jgi:hypothetical protein
MPFPLALIGVDRLLKQHRPRHLRGLSMNASTATPIAAPDGLSAVRCPPSEVLAAIAEAQARRLQPIRTRDGAMTKTLKWLRQLTCGLRGHDEVLHFERNRLSLRCLSCGHQTAGWNLARDVVRREEQPVTRRSLAARIVEARDAVADALRRPMARHIFGLTAVNERHD